MSVPGHILEGVRKELLDFSMRNPLLNYRVLKTRGVEVAGGLPADVYRLLVDEAKHTSFFSSEDDERNEGLRTAVPSKLLQTRLLATYYAARTTIEEQGVNTLFLALGMLHWREPDSDDEFHRAPLLLVPVELERTDARQKFRLKFTGDDPGENVALIEFLKQSFGIRMPELPDPDDLDVTAYFAAVKKAVAGEEKWSVDDNAVVLGFFSFAKFLMYHDLDPDTWPEEKTLLGNELINRLLGAGTLGGSPSPYSDGDFVDNHLAGKKVFHVVDADSSQTVAMLDVASGRSMVIQGPPGTGKSQTIVNLIAEALGEGKRVLFVAEKKTALEVVKRRLDAAGLGPACLELHSNKANKKAVIEELKRTASIKGRARPQVDAELAALEPTRSRLNEYCRAVNLPVGKSAESPCVLYGRFLAIAARLDAVDPPSLDIPGVCEWTDVELQRKRSMVKTLQDRVGQCGVPVAHAFWGSRLRIFLPTQRDALRQRLIRGAECARRLDAAGHRIAALLGIPVPMSAGEAQVACATCRKLLAAPSLDGVGLVHVEWTSQAAEIGSAIVAGKRLVEIHRQWNARLQPDAWTADASALRIDLGETGRHWWRFLSGRWRAAKRQLAGLVAGPLPEDLAGMLQVVDALLEAARVRASLASMEPLMRRLFGGSFSGESSDWGLLQTQFEWITSALEAIRTREIGGWVLDRAQRPFDRTALGELCAALETAIAEEEAARSEIVKALDFDVKAAPMVTLADSEARWTAMVSRIGELELLVGYNQAAHECGGESLQSLVDVADTWERAATRLVDVFDRFQISSLLELAFRERPVLASFDGLQQGQLVEQFRQLDIRQLELNRLRVAAEHARRLPVGGSANGQIGVLWHEFEKKGRFLALRKLMGKAGNAVQAIKPVFMMSPLSIANFLPPAVLEFDVVIFDEASQVRPADALGAVARGSQVVVVGDSKQLPPTSFFDTLVADADTDDEEGSSTSDIESILGLFRSRGAPERMLRWHYRSRHESLIAVSNHLFYDEQLIVFPSPDHERKRLGLIYHRVENAPYDRGRTRTNAGEAQAVAAAVIAHAREQVTRPAEERLSLGVAAFSIAQMDAIRARVEVLRRENPDCDDFFAVHPSEEFFVKNLESVQGDERDVIFISVGYGRTAEGHLPSNFGVNRAGGERRLNVLITRARQRCEVFTTLSADDIDLSRSTSAGVAALKTFLAYAQTGVLDIPVQTQRPMDSVFEERVLEALTRRGFVVHPQVGSAGFYLDLAVVDPERPGRYVLGIECDGAAYHSARSARDRDRLRQAVLEGLGWRIHRIWSTDWFRYPERELNKVVDAIQGAPREPVPAVELAEPAPTPVAAAPVDTRMIYQTAKLDIELGHSELHEIEPVTLAGWLQQVVEVESPVYWLEATRRVTTAAGVQRVGSRIQEAFERACRAGCQAGSFVSRSGFLWRTNMEEPPVRDRTDLPSPAKKIEYVAPEEIRAAIEKVARESYGVVADEVASGACRLLGFARVTDEMREAIESHRDELLASGKLVARGESLVCADE